MVGVGRGGVGQCWRGLWLGGVSGSADREGVTEEWNKYTCTSIDMKISQNILPKLRYI